MDLIGIDFISIPIFFINKKIIKKKDDENFDLKENTDKLLEMIDKSTEEDVNYSDNKISCLHLAVQINNADVVAIPASIGVRFYFNKRDKDNGFFLLPKVGMTILAVNGRDYSAGQEQKSAIANFYISGEMGFKIDMFTKMGANWPVRPFIDISILDFGYSFTHGIRFVPLPRLAVGVAF